MPHIPALGDVVGVRRGDEPVTHMMIVIALHGNVNVNTYESTCQEVTIMPVCVDAAKGYDSLAEWQVVRREDATCLVCIVKNKFR